MILSASRIMGAGLLAITLMSSASAQLAPYRGPIVEYRPLPQLLPPIELSQEAQLGWRHEQQREVHRQQRWEQLQRIARTTRRLPVQGEAAAAQPQWVSGNVLRIEPIELAGEPPHWFALLESDRGRGLIADLGPVDYVQQQPQPGERLELRGEWSELGQRTVLVVADMRRLPPAPPAGLGVSLAESADQPGVLVTRVAPDSPAAAAGVEAGDTIVEINRRPVNTSQQLVRMISRLTPNTPVDVTVWRDGDLLNFNAMLSIRAQVVAPGDAAPE